MRSPRILSSSLFTRKILQSPTPTNAHMGCCVSTEVAGEGEAPSRRLADRPVEVVWEKDDPV